MPLKPHPTDPDKMVYVSRQYDMPDTPTARAYLAKVLEDDDIQVYQKPWVEPTGNEWFEWWRLSKVADETEAEIDFADFLIIAQAVVAKLKEKNNG